MSAGVNAAAAAEPRITYKTVVVADDTAFVRDRFKSVLEGSNSNSEALGSLTVSEMGSWKNVKRSSGTFAHPSMAAYYFEYILPIVLASFLTVNGISAS